MAYISSHKAVSWLLAFVNDGELWRIVDGVTVERAWKEARVLLIAPLLWSFMVLCLVATVMILVEKLVMGAASLAVKVFRLKPERMYAWKPMEPDLEIGSYSYPMVLIQIPMYNEKEVYKLSINAACNLDWPTERLIVQVLDDSTDPVLKEMVELECRKWESKGVNICYEWRDNRKGYKAGALNQGMKHLYVQCCEYVAMFDADFQPESDFLVRIMPFLIHNPEIALVQTRWKFVNANECMLTRLQEMSLDYHFKVEQEAGSSMFAFFGFNGTAGVWRIGALKDAGGWYDRTTVEDMDLAVRAGLRGWKFVYVGDIKVKNELPSTFKAYRYQQHRWSCGPANLFKKMLKEIIRNEKVSGWKKLHIIYSFFFVGKIVAHTVTFVFYCVVIPMCVVVPEVRIPLWGVAYVPTIITFCKLVGTPSSAHLVVFWILFENVMSLHRTKAAMTGLLDAERVNEWIVTTKLGKKLNDHTKAMTEVTVDAPLLEDDGKPNGIVCSDFVKKVDSPIARSRCRFHRSEIVMGIFLGVVALYDVRIQKTGFFIFLFLQAIAFFIAGFDYVGSSVAA